MKSAVYISLLRAILCAQFFLTCIHPVSAFAAEEEGETEEKIITALDHAVLDNLGPGQSNAYFFNMQEETLQPLLLRLKTIAEKNEQLPTTLQSYEALRTETATEISQFFIEQIGQEAARRRNAEWVGESKLRAVNPGLINLPSGIVFSADGERLKIHHVVFSEPTPYRQRGALNTSAVSWMGTETSADALNEWREKGISVPIEYGGKEIVRHFDPYHINLYRYYLNKATPDTLNQNMTYVGFRNTEVPFNIRRPPLSISDAHRISFDLLSYLSHGRVVNGDALHTQPLIHDRPSLVMPTNEEVAHFVMDKKFFPHVPAPASSEFLPGQQLFLNEGPIALMGGNDSRNVLGAIERRATWHTQSWIWRLLTLTRPEMPGAVDLLRLYQKTYENGVTDSPSIETTLRRKSHHWDTFFEFGAIPAPTTIPGNQLKCWSFLEDIAKASTHPRHKR